jgi:hypothetical protein
MQRLRAQIHATVHLGGGVASGLVAESLVPFSYSLVAA